MVKFVFLITALSRASKNIRRNLVINSYPSHLDFQHFAFTPTPRRLLLKTCMQSTPHIKDCRVPQILPGVCISNDTGFITEENSVALESADISAIP